MLLATCQLAAMRHAGVALSSVRSLNEWRGIDGSRSPLRTAIAPFASAVELLGLFSMKPVM